MYSSILLGMICACIAFGDAAQWGYSVQGDGYVAPDSWDTLNNSCNGERQSPIDIVTAKADYDKTLGETKFEDYDVVPETMAVVNNGHTVHFEPTWDTSIPLISGGGLSEDYKAKSFHMHWGSDNTKGSEHTVDGKQYPAELHVIHTKGGQEVPDVAEMSDGIVVLTFFLEEGDDDNTAFQKMIDAMKTVPQPDNDQSVDPPIKLSDVLPEDKKKFYKYAGSLTTPGCNEAVTFYIFDEKIKLSAAQFGQLRTAVNYPANQTMVDNFRDPQPINSRVVHVSTRDPENGSSMISSNVFSAVLLGVFSYLFH